MTDKPSESEYRDLFARFGLAYYQSECVYLQLCADFSVAETGSRYDTTRPRIEERFAQALSLTFGELIGQLRHLLPLEICDNLKLVLEARNFLAHRFWIERSLQVESRAGVNGLKKELDEYATLFEHADQQTTLWFNQKMQQIGGVDF